MEGVTGHFFTLVTNLPPISGALVKESVCGEKSTPPKMTSLIAAMTKRRKMSARPQGADGSH
jgi:hypothetical protein